MDKKEKLLKRINIENFRNDVMKGQSSKMLRYLYKITGDELKILLAETGLKDQLHVTTRYLNSVN